MVAYKIRRKPLVNRYIAWLKLQVSKKSMVTAVDVVDAYAKIAFADITDFVKIENNRLKLYDGELIDGQLISKIRQGKDGVSIEMVDKLRALEKLERYFDCMPKDWKQKIEEKKLDLMEQKLELDKKRYGTSDEELGDDGFIEALRESAQEVWGDDNENN